MGGEKKIKGERHAAGVLSRVSDLELDGFLPHLHSVLVGRVLAKQLVAPLNALAIARHAHARRCRAEERLDVVRVEPHGQLAVLEGRAVVAQEELAHGPVGQQHRLHLIVPAHLVQVGKKEEKEKDRGGDVCVSVCVCVCLCVCLCVCVYGGSLISLSLSLLVTNAVLTPLRQRQVSYLPQAFRVAVDGFLQMRSLQLAALWERTQKGDS